jgi:putative ABC transport system substrate-binding protein
VPIVGFLNAGSSWEFAPMAAAFRQGLAEARYVEGRNVLVEYRWAEGHYERLPAMAADLVRRNVAVIVANGPAAAPAKAATTTVPIVFQTAQDPVAVGLVASLNRPGGNLTGITKLGAEVSPKRLELLRELLPAATTMVFLENANSANPRQREIMQTAARTLGLQLQFVDVAGERDFDAAFASMQQLGAGALVISNDAFFTSRNEQLAALALRHGLPSVGPFRGFPQAGGLMSYGGSLTEGFRLAGVYAGRIVKGERPADLPVQQATRIELVINMKTARALGLTFPLTLLGRADEVIE